MSFKQHSQTTQAIIDLCYSYLVKLCVEVGENIESIDKKDIEIALSHLRFKKQNMGVVGIDELKDLHQYQLHKVSKYITNEVIAPYIANLKATIKSRQKNKQNDIIKAHLQISKLQALLNYFQKMERENANTTKNAMYKMRKNIHIKRRYRASMPKMPKKTTKQK